MALRFDEDWMTDEQREATAALAGSVNHIEGEVIEIGTWQGLSAIPIANAVAPAVLHIVDHWQGDNLNPEALAKGWNIPRECVDRDNYGICLANLNEATAGNYQAWKMDWRDFMREWGTRPVRFLHLDGPHTEDEVDGQIRALRPLMVPGGIMAGDDWNWPGVNAAVQRYFPDTEIRFGRLWIARF